MIKVYVYMCVLERKKAALKLATIIYKGLFLKFDHNNSYHNMHGKSSTVSS